MTRRGLSRRDLVKAGIVAPFVATSWRNAMGSAQASEPIVPFSYRASQGALDDLRRRLVDTRWPERETIDDWSEGVPLDRLRTLVEYWRDSHDWRRAETALNRFPQFRTELDGLGIHFIHARSRIRTPGRSS